MKFEDYEKAAGSTALYPNRGNNLAYPVLGLAGESGEVAEMAKKMIRDDAGELTDARKARIAAELGDVLWYIAACAHEIGVPMADIAQANVDKLASRAKRGKIHGEGDER